MPHDEHGDSTSRTVDSLSGQDTSYRVDLQTLECTCQEWTAYRLHFPAGDLRRCCKHLVYALARDPRHGPPNLGQSRTLSRFQRLAGRREGFPLCRRILPVSIPVGSEGKKATADLFFPLDPTVTPWVTVLIGKGVFRYHPAEDRWANGIAPPQSVRDALELRIHKALNQEQAMRRASTPEPVAPQPVPVAPPPDDPSADSSDDPSDDTSPDQSQSDASGRKPLRFETPGASDSTLRRRKRRGWLIFLVILLGGVLYWSGTITMPPLGKKAEGPVIDDQQPQPGGAPTGATVPDVPSSLEPPLPQDSATPPPEAQRSQPGDPPEWDLREPLSNAALAADLLKLIDRDPNRGRYTISRQVEGGTLLFGADLDLDVIFRIYRGNDGAERSDRWIGHIRHRLQSASAGGSLDAVPEQGS